MNATKKSFPKRLRRVTQGALVVLVLSGSAISSASALDLYESYQLALKQDATFQAALATAAASREALPQALSQLLPNLSGSGARSKNQTESATPGFSGVLNHSSYEYFSSNYALSLRQPIYRKYNFAQYRQAQSQVVGAEAVLDKDRQDLLTRLCGSYFDALLASESLALIVAQKEAYAAQLKSAKRYLETGLGTRTDVDDAQARYDLILAQEFEARANVDHTRRQLQVIVNQPVTSLATLNAAKLELVSPVPGNPDEWTKRGEEINAELRAMRANVEAARQEVEKANAGHYPTVDLVMQRSKSGSANDTSINQHYLTNQLGVQFNIPIFSGGYASSSQRQAVASLEKFEQLYEAKRRDVDAQIRKEYENVAQGVLKVKALEQAERSADQAVFSNQKGFQAGTRTLVDILNAQQQRMNTLRDLAQARYQYLMSRVRLQNLVGTLDENEINTINSWLSAPGVKRASLR